MIFENNEKARFTFQNKRALIKSCSFDERSSELKLFHEIIKSTIDDETDVWRETKLSLLSKNEILSKSFRILFDLIQNCARVENVWKNRLRIENYIFDDTTSIKKQ